ncbi:selenium metabolism-associated LysR family transcriptional regulator [Desulfobotulus sp. H1]|uniref:Selenium metabolism-associated LysR family transcriptional regulator n=1 Tax=Desulfobotulus pelophilus TaxID=2823377 RepID=A0ABT3NCU9_9BACT|nr:selenium metabolism-associated LysR family transcriptional regulator [Desulfobotulus pelophilus]MCW7754787.1 selenium metabolism-associated LysR family transcriptional regulator [Desulfobotulus pelophilus]
MDIWQLNIFCKVIERKSFSRAGQAVHLSQPTISSHIRDLENHFGCRLIDRLGKEAVPTKAGSLLYQHARRILQLRDEAEAAMAAFQGSIRGRFVIGGSTIPGAYILPRLIGGFAQRYPDVTLSLEISDSEAILAATLDGHLELGIIGAITKDRRAEQACILEDTMGLMLPGNHPMANTQSIEPTDLCKLPFILREKGSGTRQAIASHLKTLGLSIEDLNIVAEMGNTQAVIQGIKSGLGVSILSPVAVEDELAANRLCCRKIEGLHLRRNFYLTRHKDRTPSPLCSAFISYIQEAYHLSGPLFQQE